jgi:hypothetical protein
VSGEWCRKVGPFLELRYVVGGCSKSLRRPMAADGGGGTPAVRLAAYGRDVLEVTEGNTIGSALGNGKNNVLSGSGPGSSLLLNAGGRTPSQRRGRQAKCLGLAVGSQATQTQRLKPNKLVKACCISQIAKKHSKARARDHPPADSQTNRGAPPCFAKSLLV